MDTAQESPDFRIGGFSCQQESCSCCRWFFSARRLWWRNLRRADRRQAGRREARVRHPPDNRRLIPRSPVIPMHNRGIPTQIQPIPMRRERASPRPRNPTQPHNPVVKIPTTTQATATLSQERRQTDRRQMVRRIRVRIPVGVLHNRLHPIDKA
jgi:hypothetical protein